MLDLLLRGAGKIIGIPLGYSYNKEGKITRLVRVFFFAIFSNRFLTVSVLAVYCGRERKR
jgi:uncharacterized membrane protein (Fun14 family)